MYVHIVTQTYPETMAWYNIRHSFLITYLHFARAHTMRGMLMQAALDNFPMLMKRFFGKTT